MPYFLSVCCYFIVDMEITAMAEGRKKKIKNLQVSSGSVSIQGWVFVQS